MKTTYLTLLLLLSLTLSCAQKSEKLHSMLNIDLLTIDKDSSLPIPLTVIEILSGNNRIGVVSGDFDGAGIWSICSKKLIDNKITLKIHGINYKIFENVYEFKNNLKLTIKMESGKSKFKNRTEREVFIRDELGIPFCSTTENMDEELENANYQHCDGRIKPFNEITSSEISQWEKIKQ